MITKKMILTYYCTPALNMHFFINGKCKLTRMEMFVLNIIKTFQDSNSQEYLNSSIEKILNLVFDLRNTTDIMRIILRGLYDKNVISAKSRDKNDIEEVLLKNLKINSSSISKDGVYCTVNKKQDIRLVYDNMIKSDLTCFKFGEDIDEWYDDYLCSDAAKCPLLKKQHDLANDCKKRLLRTTPDKLKSRATKITLEDSMFDLNISMSSFEIKKAEQLYVYELTSEDNQCKKMKQITDQIETCILGQEIEVTHIKEIPDWIMELIQVLKKIAISKSENI